MVQSFSLPSVQGRRVPDQTEGRKSCFVSLWTDSAIQPELPSELREWNGTVYVGWERTGVGSTCSGKRCSSQKRKRLAARAAVTGSKTYCHSWRVPIVGEKTLQDVHSALQESGLSVSWGRGVVGMPSDGRQHLIDVGRSPYPGKETATKNAAKQGSANRQRVRDAIKASPLPVEIMERCKIAYSDLVDCSPEIPSGWTDEDHLWFSLCDRFAGFAQAWHFLVIRGDFDTTYAFELWYRGLGIKPPFRGRRGNSDQPTEVTGDRGASVWDGNSSTSVLADLRSQGIVR